MVNANVVAAKVAEARAEIDAARLRLANAKTVKQIREADEAIQFWTGRVVMTKQTASGIDIVTVPQEDRQIAKVMEFDATLAPHINWDSVAQTARELGAHFEARYADRGACTITMFWSYSAEEN